jgi:hypothetical protein
MPEPTLNDVARAALLEITPEATIGAPAGEITEGDGVVSVQFESLLPGYPGWKWTVSIASLPGEAPSVLETEMIPAEGALLAPDWVPWSDRLADYKAAQSELEAASAEDSEESEDETDDDDDDDLGSDVLHGGDLDGVDIDESEDETDDDSDESDDDDADDLDDDDDDDPDEDSDDDDSDDDESDDEDAEDDDESDDDESDEDDDEGLREP